MAAAVPVPRTPERIGYEHLAPLWVEFAAARRGEPREVALRAELILGYGPVARNIARRFGRRGEFPEDVEQVAHLGLVLAVDRFDPTRGIEFLSFAVPTITGEVLRHLRDRAAPIRVPRRLRQIQGRIHDAAAELAQRNGRAARPSEIAAHLDVAVELVLEGLAAQRAGYPDSLDEPARDDEGSGHRARFGAALGCVEPHYELIEQHVVLAPLLSELPDRERRILHLRFVDGLTQSQIAEQIGISQMHVSRLLSRTVRALRRRLAA